MISVDNILFMKERFPLVWDAYREAELKQNDYILEETPTRLDHCPTLCVHRGNRSYYLHSRYDPLREAQTIIDNIDVDSYDHVVFYGIGLGYHIQTFLDRYPHLSFSIYEPIPEVFEFYLSHFDLRDLPQRRLREIAVETSPQVVRDYLQRTIAQIQKNILFVDLPSYRNAFPEQHSAFLKLFKEIVSNQRISLATNVAYEKRWIINSLLNFKTVLNTPNIIVERNGYFKDKPAVLVAAGPSLDYELENLKYLKENGLAYIFSVGSAINSLLASGIKPHAQCTYDPSENNQKKVFSRITKEQITDIPLIFGSSVGFEVLQNYPGKHKMHMITSQDTISSYLLQIEDNTQLDGVYDAPSIAVVTLQMLYKLGFNPIILVGQNLSYGDGRLYAEGIDYWKGALLDYKTVGALIKIKDVAGNEVYTTPSFNQMRIAMESVIRSTEKVKFINTTRGGAHIEGTEFCYLDQMVAENFFNEQVVEPSWYDIPVTNYNREYLKKRFYRFKKDYEELVPSLVRVLEIISEIDAWKEKGSHRNIDYCWPKLDDAFKKVTRNQVFKSVLRPMNRVAIEALFAQIPIIRHESDPVHKAEEAVGLYGRVVKGCLVDMQLIAPCIAELDEIVNRF